jgi:hypothetical protein
MGSELGFGDNKNGSSTGVSPVLGNIPTESPTCGISDSLKSKRRAAFRVLDAEQKLLSSLYPAFLNEAKKRQVEGDADGAKLAMQVSRHHVRKCCRDTVPAERRDKKTGQMVATGAPGQAEVHAAGGESSSHVWVGVKHCASTWFCPVCGPKVMARRRQEIEKCVELMKSGGQQFMFCTFTFPHTYGAPLSTYMDKLRDVLKMFRRGKSWDLFKKRVEMVGYIRAQEVTHGNHGWHPHYHELLITKALSKEEAESAAAFLSKRWVDVCRRAGLISDEKAQDAYAHAVDVKSGADPVTQEYLSKLVCWELSSVTTKATKTKGLQPFQILSNACNGDGKSKKLWVEYMLGMYRKAALYWSPGLKELCGIDELTDEQLLEGEVEKEPVLIASSRAFLHIAKRRLQVPILELTEEQRMGTVRKIDSKLGLHLIYGSERAEAGLAQKTRSE